MLDQAGLASAPWPLLPATQSSFWGIKPDWTKVNEATTCHQNPPSHRLCVWQIVDFAWLWLPLSGRDPSLAPRGGNCFRFHSTQESLQDISFQHDSHRLRGFLDCPQPVSVSLAPDWLYPAVHAYFLPTCWTTSTLRSQFLCCLLIAFLTLHASASTYKNTFCNVIFFCAFSSTSYIYLSRFNLIELQMSRGDRESKREKNEQKDLPASCLTVYKYMFNGSWACI